MPKNTFLWIFYSDQVIKQNCGFLCTVCSSFMSAVLCNQGWNGAIRLKLYPMVLSQHNSDSTFTKKTLFFHNSCTEVDFATFVGRNVRSFKIRVFISLKKIPFSIKISMQIFLFCSWITNIKTEEQVRFGCDLPFMFFKLTLTCKWTCMCIAGLRIVNNYAHKKAMLLKCSSVLE